MKGDGRAAAPTLSLTLIWCVMLADVLISNDIADYFTKAQKEHFLLRLESYFDPTLCVHARENCTA